jgi:tellurite resistance protein
MIETLVGVAAIDGALSPQEDETIRSVALELGLNEPGYHRIRSKFVAYQPTVH